MNPTLFLALVTIVAPLGIGALGYLIGDRIRRNRLASRTLLIGIDKQRGDVELRYVKVRDNKIVWGKEKGGNFVHDGVVTPGEGTPWTLNGAGRGFIINRRTLATMRVAATGEELETAPEDGWQIGMYAVGVHERNIARPSGGTWLDTLAGYTPILVIAVGIILIVGIALVSGKLSGK